jgi:hypothetical protein
LFSRVNSSAGTFYVTGGTLRADAASYAERRAEHALPERLKKGGFRHVLTGAPDERELLPA